MYEELEQIVGSWDDGLASLENGVDQIRHALDSMSEYV
jgi:hypothetical protein